MTVSVPSLKLPIYSRVWTVFVIFEPPDLRSFIHCTYAMNNCWQILIYSTIQGAGNIMFLHFLWVTSTYRWKISGSVEEKGTQKGELTTSALYSDYFTFLLRDRSEKRSTVSLASGSKWHTQEVKWADLERLWAGDTVSLTTALLLGLRFGEQIPDI